MADQYLFETKTFREPGTWLRKFFLVASLILIIVGLSYNDTKPDIIKLSLLIFAGLWIVFYPVDDVAVDSNNFYILKKSSLSLFSRKMTFDIAEIKAVHCKGSYARKSGMTGFNGLVSSNEITITFTDEEVNKLKVTVPMEDLVLAAEQVHKIILSNKTVKRSR